MGGALFQRISRRKRGELDNALLHMWNDMFFLVVVLSGFVRGPRLATVLKTRRVVYVTSKHIILDHILRRGRRYVFSLHHTTLHHIMNFDRDLRPPSFRLAR